MAMTPRYHDADLEDKLEDQEEPCLRFPTEAVRALGRKTATSYKFPCAHVEPSTRAGDDVMHAFDIVSRRMEDLARELDCLPGTGGDEDPPRAA